MKQLLFFTGCLCAALGMKCWGIEISHAHCRSIEEVISLETEKISNTHPTHIAELAEAHVSRGESYLLNTQYDKAIADFEHAHRYLSSPSSVKTAMQLVFRIAFAEAICYDNLGMLEHTRQALQQLQLVAEHMGCSQCQEGRPYRAMITPSSSVTHFRNLIRVCTDNYSDILGPDDVDMRWCEEMVVGTGRTMDAIACLAKNYVVKAVLIGVIEALVARGVKCCQTGDFWKACVAPIARKWKEWKINRENDIFPNELNLPVYIH